MKEDAYTNEPVQLTVALPLRGHERAHLPAAGLHRKGVSG